MASRRDVEEFRRALNSLSGRAWSDFAPLWDRIKYRDFAEIRRVLADVWPDLVAEYGEMSATMAADLFEDWVPGATASMVRPVDEALAMSRARWAIGTAQAAGNLNTLLDELVKQPARSTMARSAQANDVRWARVPTGAETCAFCLMLASRGFVYGSAETAGQMRKFHGHCDCVAVAGDSPEGYDPDALYEVYASAHRPGQPTKETLSRMRASGDVSDATGSAGGAGGGGRPPTRFGTPPDPGDRDRVNRYWKTRQDALEGPNFTAAGDVLKPHEVEFAERALAAGERMRWIPQAKSSPTNDFVWVSRGGIEVELKSVVANAKSIHRRIDDAVIRAAKHWEPMAKSRFIIDIGDAALTEQLREDLAGHNVGRRNYRITQLWVMSQGRIEEIALRT